MSEEVLYSISQIRSIENQAQTLPKLSEAVLMQRAGRAAWHILQERWPTAKSILVLCGSGNNGGDGYILAMLAKKAGLEVIVRYLGSTQNTLLGDMSFEEAGIVRQVFDPAELIKTDLMIDALLGIGVKDRVRPEYAQAINWINQSGRPVLALDVPSGLDADTGSILGVAVKATVTITYIGLKQGMFTNDGPDVCGDIQLAQLELPASLYPEPSDAVTVLTPDMITILLKPRLKNAHKGDFGHVLVVGGENGMGGAVRLAAEAALRVGAGLVSVATRAENVPLVCAEYPEIMCHAVDQPDSILPLLAKANVIIVGPGLGQQAWGNELLKLCCAVNIPCVLDADALNLLGVRPIVSDHWVLTPHPGEAARLLDWSDAKTVQADRFKALQDLSALGGAWLLKGVGTLIKGKHLSTKLCRHGNPGMASGGMGDALSGIIGGLMAQRITPENAASLGVLIHALAGDFASEESQRGLLASDLIDSIRTILSIYTTG